jgi:hypothetical protein
MARIREPGRAAYTGILVLRIRDKLPSELSRSQLQTAPAPASAVHFQVPDPVASSDSEHGRPGQDLE